MIYPGRASEPVRLPEVLDGRGWLRRPRMSRGHRSSGKLQEPRRRSTASRSADIPDQRLHPEARALVVTPSPAAAAAALSQVPRPSLVSSSPATSTHQGTGLRMQSLVRNVCRAGSRGAAARLLELAAAHPGAAQPSSAVKHLRQPYGFARPTGVDHSVRVQSRALPAAAISGFGLCAKVLVATRGLSTVGNAAEVASDSDDSTSLAVEHPPRIKFKRPDKTARHIMNILNKEAVEKVRSEREIPDVQPGCMIQMRLQVPENKRRELTLKGIVLGRRNAGINTTFRLRRLVSGVGVESVFPLYSPNIKEIKILDRKKVRRAKLYYLRDRVNALKK